ncbi:MAG: thioredoxin family protein [Bacteroidota bacterium]|nr:thioredoxin family protein [Bacteroidota bacterium]
MKTIYLVILAMTAIMPITTYAQEKVQIYDPKANAEIQVKEAVAKASKENKHVVLQIGGNWCVWCVRLNAFEHTNPKIDSILKANYILVHINYSPENKNAVLLKKLEFPQRFGFPVLVILDAKGRRLHTQDSGFLEAAKNTANIYYDEQKVVSFLSKWTPAALNPENYLNH